METTKRRVKKKYKRQLTKENLKRYLESVAVLSLIAMGLGISAGMFLLMFNPFWQLVFK